MSTKHLTIQHSVIDLHAIPRRMRPAESSKIMFGPLYIDDEDDTSPAPLIDLREISRPESETFSGAFYIIASRMVKRKATLP